MNEDKIIQKLIEHDERFDSIEQKLDSKLGRDEYLKGQDEIMTILRRLDQERIFTAEWIRRIENDVDKVKKQLNII